MEERKAVAERPLLKLPDPKPFIPKAALIGRPSAVGPDLPLGPKTVWRQGRPFIMRCGHLQLIGEEWFLVAEACNHPNCLVLPFSVELIRPAA